MRATRAIAEQSVLGATYLVGGAVALAVAFDGAEPRLGTFEIVVAALAVLLVAVMFRWQLRLLRRAPWLPDWIAVSSTVDMLWRTLLPSAIAPAAIVYLCNNTHAHGIWVFGPLLAVLGASHLALAALAARVERRDRRHVVRANNRYFLAH